LVDCFRDVGELAVTALLPDSRHTFLERKRDSRRTLPRNPPSCPARSVRAVSRRRQEPQQRRCKHEASPRCSRPRDLRVFQSFISLKLVATSPHRLFLPPHPATNGAPRPAPHPLRGFWMRGAPWSPKLSGSVHFNATGAGSHPRAAFSVRCERRDGERGL
jgi:hypothetical protein